MECLVCGQAVLIETYKFHLSVFVNTLKHVFYRQFFEIAGINPRFFKVCEIDKPGRRIFAILRDDLINYLYFRP